MIEKGFCNAFRTQMSLHQKCLSTRMSAPNCQVSDFGMLQLATKQLKPAIFNFAEDMKAFPGPGMTS